jgi:hypothetical protein
MSDSKEQVVIASFDGPADAEQAAKDLMGWDKANDEIKLGAIGVLSKDAKGEIKTKTFSARNTGRARKSAWAWVSRRRSCRAA